MAVQLAPTDREAFMDVGQVAAWLNLSPAAVRAAAADNRLPAYRILSEWRFLESELQAYLNANRTQVVHRISPNERKPRGREARATGRKRPAASRGSRAMKKAAASSH